MARILWAITLFAPLTLVATLGCGGDDQKPQVEEQAPKDKGPPQRTNNPNQGGKNQDSNKTPPRERPRVGLQ
jgi:hypothetical protein